MRESEQYGCGGRLYAYPSGNFHYSCWVDSRGDKIYVTRYRIEGDGQWHIRERPDGLLEWAEHEEGGICSPLGEVRA